MNKFFAYLASLFKKGAPALPPAPSPAPVPDVEDLMLIVTHNDLTTLTGTLYGEARGCTQAQQENIAQVILNRVKDGWGTSVKDVCLAPYQFDCWMHNDPNYIKILNAPLHDTVVWDRLLLLATAALSGKNPNRVVNADSYYAVSMRVAPTWTKAPSKLIYNDGASIYYRVRRA